LSVQVTAYGRQTVPDRGVVRSCDPLKVWGSSHITGTAERKVVKFCRCVGYINSRNRMTSPTKVVCLWSRDCFAVMQRVARVCQRQLSYLLESVTMRCWAVNGSATHRTQWCHIDGRWRRPCSQLNHGCSASAGPTSVGIIWSQ